jgi:hypothetical protein
MIHVWPLQCATGASHDERCELLTLSVSPNVCPVS